jgi:uncharacterized membrane protein YqgA involved in biofilm formation
MVSYAGAHDRYGHSDQHRDGVGGGTLGTVIGARLSEGMRETAMHAIGLVTVLVGIQSFLRFDNPLVPLVSVIVGLVIGELIGIDGALKRFGDAPERRFSRGGSPVNGAFVTTSLLFCVGALAVLGSLQNGISGDYRLLAPKSAPDFVASLSFAAVLGWGVLLSSGSVLVVEGGLTLAGALFGSFMTRPLILAFTSTGGVLLLGLVLLSLKEVRVANMLPALVVPRSSSRRRRGGRSDFRARHGYTNMRRTRREMGT